MATNSLAVISEARRQLSTAKSLTDILNIRDKAKMLEALVASTKAGKDAAIEATDIRLLAERKVGEVLASMEKQRPGEYQRYHDGTVAPKLEDIGISKNQSSRWQKMASVPEEQYVSLVEECRTTDKELTQAALLSLAGAGHVSHASGENEWYTPSVYIEAAREAMRGIDLDPASSAVAQETVKAGTFYSIDDDGLAKVWFGNVWLNPPYSKDLIGRFIERLRLSFEDGQIAQAVVLINNATETAWFQKLGSVASAFCFTSGRIKFNDKNGKPANSPLQGQCFIYLGDSVDRFCASFQSFGLVCRK